MSGPRRVLTALASVETFGAALTGGGALFIAFKALFPIGEMDPVTIAFLGLALLLAAIALGQLRLAWSRTERFTIPPQTSVTLAFDFSDDVSGVLDPAQRRVYASRDPAFAEAFAALNRDRVWTPDPAAQRTESLLKIALVVFLALAALAGWVLNA